MAATTESTSRTTDIEPKPATSTTANIMVLLMGVYLGILFTKSEVANWQRVHDMFLFREAYMYLIIGTAIVVAMISMLLIKRFSIKSIEGEKKITYKPKPYHTGVIIGGMLFGAGWAITGACAGRIREIGAGEWMAHLTLGGALYWECLATRC